MKEQKDLGHFEVLDRDLVAAASRVKVLSTIAWPPEVQNQFLEDWSKKRRHLPRVELHPPQLKDVTDELIRIVQAATSDHPIGRYLQQTALSYFAAARMLESAGTPAFLELSRQIYGSFDSSVVHSGLSNLEFAQDFIDLSDDLDVGTPNELESDVLTPEQVAIQLKVEADRFFTHHKIEVVVDPALTSKAAAGAQRLRIRGRTKFSQRDVDQLLQHELFVHTATTLNGRLQPRIKSLGLGAPRTTCTQEGLATFAEFITSSIDIGRLRRLALRIVGVSKAAEGADFIDLFEFFHDSGQSPQESFQSAARIFRGGNVHGKIYFTKDTVYLKGLFLVHTFLRKAIEARKIEFPVHLFIGKMTVGDVVDLEPYVENGYLVQPFYRPEWIVNRHRLAAYLSYALMANKLNLKQIKLEDFVEEKPMVAV